MSRWQVMQRAGQAACLLLIVAGVAAAGWRGCDVLAGNHAVDFYGVVVENHGQPVPGAVVKLNVVRQNRLLIGIPGAGVGTTKTQLELVSDGSGRFALEGMRGTSLQIEDIQAKGYRNNFGDRSRKIDPSQFTFHAVAHGAPQHQPDESNPVVFHLTPVGR